MHPVTRKILANRPSLAQIRALKLAALEGALGCHRNRWAPPSRTEGLGTSSAVMPPYERGATVFALQHRGYLKPDPRFERGELGNVPRPKVLTQKGLEFLGQDFLRNPTYG